MNWFKRMFMAKEKDKEIDSLRRMVEQSNETIKLMDGVIKRLEDNMTKSRQESAATLQEEKEYQDQMKLESERMREYEYIQNAQKVVSTYLTKYLDRFNLIENRFSLAHNIDLLSNSDDLMFKIVQMIKLSKTSVEFATVWNNHVIRISIDNDEDDVYYSINGGKNLSSDIVGTKFLTKFKKDIQLDILNFPCVQTNKIYEVTGKKYKYVLANSRRECYYILKDKEMKTKIKEVSFVEPSAYTRSIRSRLVYVVPHQT
ncbi:hypothetical protein AR9_g144 [Bacillus phage AR9]|uniref:Uncharacterized protein n=2 Tax=Bacillus phage PBS1 TaxID=10683 RepID=A0A172JI58_BPPB1|nr:hypothetical protein BI022_gp143 [Bacillus phage AR9]YP_009664232.1 hypothetical protein FK780_gp030 [Bacillus phage PBS1]PTU25721.1 hypothetical protein DA469_22290 [Bacillus subtilis]QXN70066.1 hypothetical protein INTERNEXUS_25 [Bacillus phage vB_BspM_Internexus]WCS68269.1 hypothetical protein Goe21_01590 [Bacillus phage vB_BsuM-Goe21]AMS01228.1 hypothetical protein AR9_g144 [Bacillus phage AR9]AST99852.1 hypothetical protein PBI_PBS1_30 [Bacillus phage PBS1]